MKLFARGKTTEEDIYRRLSFDHILSGDVDRHRPGASIRRPTDGMTRSRHSLQAQGSTLRSMSREARNSLIKNIKAIPRIPRTRKFTTMVERCSRMLRKTCQSGGFFRQEDAGCDLLEFSVPRSVFYVNTYGLPLKIPPRRV